MDRRNIHYRALRDMAQEEARVLWKKFFVYLAGRTNGAHQPIVDKFKGMGQIEVSSEEESDYVLVFCPIVSRIGTDIEEALGNVHAGKPAALMVMHHTFNRDHVVADSRRLVDNTKVPLTADFLFYESQLLKSDRNTIAFYDIQKFFGVTPLQNIMNAFVIYIWPWRNCKGIVAVTTMLAVGMLLWYNRKRFLAEDFDH